jgi:hypothetical protein
MINIKQIIMNDNTYHEYYYLLYKLKSDSTLWIIAESINENELLERIKNFYSYKEIYYIIFKKYTKDYIKTLINLKQKRFQKFIFDDNCQITYNTDNIDNNSISILKSQYKNSNPRSTEW